MIQPLVLTFLAWQTGSTATTHIDALVRDRNITYVLQNVGEAGYWAKAAAT